MKKVIILFFVFLGLSFLGMGQVESDAPVKGEVSESLGFNFDLCTCEHEIVITASAESRSFNPLAFDESGISFISISVNPSLSQTNGYINWTWEHEEDTTPSYLWDNHTGEIEFQPLSGGGWENSLFFDTQMGVNIRVKKAGRAYLKATYVVDGVECSDIKQISVPQFYDLNFDTEINGQTFDNDLEIVGLQNSDVGVSSNQLTAARNQIVREEVIEALKFGMEECYMDINVRFTETPPVFLADNLKVICYIAGQHSPIPLGADQLPGLFNNDENTNCYSGLASSGGNLDIGNQNPSGKICVFSKLLATSDVAFLPFFGETFDGLLATNFMFDNNNTIVDNSLLIAIEKFGMLVGNTVAHEAGHALGLVPSITHNNGDTGKIMDDGIVADWDDRTMMYEFLLVNKSRIIKILPTDGQDGFE